MTDKVSDYFLTPLEAHFESQPTEGQRETILVDMEQYTPEQLNAAVEWLKRSRQSAKTFPPPKECLRAIDAVKFMASQPQRSRIDVHGNSYGDKLRSWLTGGGKAVPIFKNTHEWTEWEIYFLATGNVVQSPIMAGKESWTVPTALPSQFDRDYDWSKGDRLLRERFKAEQEFDAPHRKRFVQEQLARIGLAPKLQEEEYYGEAQ